ncbi:hypothetical protein, partial [Thalassoglobus neptunius]|uniref:hypothetical protein n=1 Tax=Thalassoglobus neptunius TaxID=1938619 RepID=UPI001E655CA4
SKSLPSHRKQLPALQNKHDLTQWQPTKTQTATQKSAMFNGLLDVTSWPQTSTSGEVQLNLDSVDGTVHF